MTLTVETLVSIAMTNPINTAITSRLPSLGLNQCMLTAGCLFQAVWNHQADQPTDWGIKDYDVFYFDTDLSWEAENVVIQSASSCFRTLASTLKSEIRPACTFGTVSALASHIPNFNQPKTGLIAT